MSQKYCVDCEDYLGRRVVYHESNRQKHLPKRPYLASKKYLRQIAATLKNPDYVFESLSVAGAFCYYRTIGTQRTPAGTRHMFVKVIVQIDGADPLVVRTTHFDNAREPREFGQTKCIYGKWP